MLTSYSFWARSFICVISLWHRKYLRDADRQVLAQQAFVLTVKVLEDTLNDLTQVRQQSVWWLLDSVCSFFRSAEIEGPHCYRF